MKACRRHAKHVCERQAECGVAQVARSPALEAGNRYDLRVAIQVLLSKYAYHLPRYRQQDLFAACGWTPRRSTLNNLLDVLSLPLVAALREPLAPAPPAPHAGMVAVYGYY